MQSRNPLRTLVPRLAPGQRRSSRPLFPRPARFGPLAVLSLVVLVVAGIFTPATAATGDNNTGDNNTGQNGTDQIGTTTNDGDGVDVGLQVRIIEVSGLIDPVLADFVLRELTEAESDGVLGIVLQLDSRGSVIDDASFIELATRLQTSPLPVAIWVGPSGSRAYGGAAELLGVADLVGVAGGSRIGELGKSRLPASQFDPPFGTATERLRTTSINGQEAVDLNLSIGPIETSSVLREFISHLPGYVAPAEDSTSAIGLSQAQFRQLPLTLGLFHTVASPEVAYLFFVGGLALLIFELFTAGVGIAGSIGAGLTILGSYGLAVLPTRPLAIAALVLAHLAFAVDIQTNIPRLYTAVGMVLFAAGTFWLYDGVSMSIITTVVGLIGALLYAYTGMPSMVRTRFSTPTIGRSWMIGEMGSADTDIDPEGTVIIRDAPWRAVTNRATPLRAGDAVRVVGLDRLVLEVEPESGGARDYRERR